MTPVFPLDGPCTQLCCLSCCFLPLTFALIDFWPTYGNQQPVTNTFTCSPRLTFTITFDCACLSIYLMYNLGIEYMLCTCTISHYAFFFFNPPDQKTSHVICLRWEEVTTVVAHCSKKTTAVTCRVQRVPFRWGSHSFDACYWHHFTEKLVIILSPTTHQAPAPKKRSCVSVRREIHSTEDNVLLWGVRCHSLSRVGHTFLSLLWWISLPGPHVDLSELKGCLWVSSSQLHKVPFVSVAFGIHPHRPTWGHLVSEDGAAQRKDQQGRPSVGKG